MGWEVSTVTRKGSGYVCYIYIGDEVHTTQLYRDDVISHEIRISSSNQSVFHGSCQPRVERCSCSSGSH